MKIEHQERLQFLIGGGLSALLNFLAIFLIKEIYGYSALGEYIIFLSLQSVMIPIMTLDIYRYIDKSAFSSNEDNGLYLTILVIIIVFSIITSIGLFLLPELYREMNVYIIVVGGALTSLITCIKVILKNSNSYLISLSIEPFRYALIAMLVYLSSVQNQILISPQQIYVFSSLMIMLPLFKFVKLTRRTYSSIELRSVLSYSIPYIPYSLGSFVGSQLDRLLLGGIAGFSDLGVYAWLQTIMSPLKIVTNALSTQFSRRVFRSENLGLSEWRATTLKFSAAFLVFLVLNFLLAMALLYIEDNLSLRTALICLLVGICFLSRGIRQVLIVISNKWGKPAHATQDFIIVLAFSLITNIIFIPMYGALGAALAITITSVIATMVWTYWILHGTK